MENEDGVEFSFYLAQKLGRTVEELGQMSNAEFMGWSVYYGRKAQRDELAARRR